MIMAAENNRPADHPADVVDSMRRLMLDIGVDDPDAYLAIWTVEEILPELTRVMMAMNDRRGPAIRNPGGLLWRRLERTYPWRAGQ